MQSLFSSSNSTSRFKMPRSIVLVGLFPLLMYLSGTLISHFLLHSLKRTNAIGGIIISRWKPFRNINTKTIYCLTSHFHSEFFMDLKICKIRIGILTFLKVKNFGMPIWLAQNDQNWLFTSKLISLWNSKFWCSFFKYNFEHFLSSYTSFVSAEFKWIESKWWARNHFVGVPKIPI